MASIQKRNKKWVAEVRVKGEYKSKSFNSKVEAQAWGAETEQFLNKNGGLVKGKTLGDAFTRYANEISPTKKGERWEVIRLNKLSRYPMASVQIQDLTAVDLDTYITKELERIKSSSVNRELNIICSVLEMAFKKWRWTSENVARDVDRPKDPPHRDRRISDDEIQRILDSLEYEEDQPVTTQRDALAVLFLLAIETACRQGELFKLQWQDVHLEQSFVCLRDTKNGSDRNVPLSSRAKVLMEKLSRKKSGLVVDYNQASCGVIFRRAIDLAGIKDLTFHDTRHEALTRLARKLDLLDLARMVGHRDPRSLMIYYNATASEIAGRLD
tara:strand:+ start:127 stop:1107 length:981 start_codon:yes stop_codon:yes gene_type:complete